MTRARAPRDAGAAEATFGAHAAVCQQRSPRPARFTAAQPRVGGEEEEHGADEAAREKGEEGSGDARACASRPRVSIAVQDAAAVRRCSSDRQTQARRVRVQLSNPRESLERMPRTRSLDERK